MLLYINIVAENRGGVEIDMYKGFSFKKGKWALYYEKCVLCGTTEKRHHSKGLCKVCYLKELFKNKGSRAMIYKDTYTKYQQQHKKEIRQYKFWLMDKYYFGGLRKQVLQRDHYSCQKCGLTNKQHLQKYKRTITIHHIDGNGCNAIKRNNDFNNLLTLCSSCHGKVDRLRYLEKLNGGTNEA